MKRVISGLFGNMNYSEDKSTVEVVDNAILPSENKADFVKDFLEGKITKDDVSTHVERRLSSNQVKFNKEVDSGNYLN